jgi:hypothetical protein
LEDMLRTVVGGELCLKAIPGGSCVVAR